MGKSANLSVDVVANTRQAQRELDGFSTKATGVLAGIAAGFTSFAIDTAVKGVTWAADELVNAVGSAAALNAALRTTQQVYGEAAGQVEEWAAAAAKNLGLSKLKALEAARGFSTFGKMLGQQGPELAGFSEGLVQVAADLGAFADLPTATAVEAIGAALRGERDPLERFGIILNDATVKAAYFAATGQEVTGVLTAQENVIGTVAAIYGQAADKTGQYARESDELAGQQQEATATLENMAAAFGEKLLPAVTTVATWVNDTLLPALRDLGDWWDTSPVAARIRELADLVKDKLLTAWEDFQEWWDTDGKEAFDTLVDALERAYQRSKEFWQAAGDLYRQLDALLEPVGGLGGLIGGILLRSVMAVGIAFLVWLEVIGFIVKAITLLVGWLANLVGWIKTAVDWVGQLVEKLQDLKPPDLTLPSIGGFLGGISPFGPAGRAGGPASFAGPTVNVTYNVPVTVPLGVHAGDVGAAIVAALDQWSARNGALPPGLLGAN